MPTASPDFTKYSEFFDKNRIKDFKAGEFIFRKGDRADCMYVVLNGKVEIDSGKRVLYIAGKGDIFGDMAMIDKSPRSADVRAFTDCTVVSFDDYAFRFLVKNMPEFTLDIMRVMAMRIRLLNDTLTT